MLVRMRSLTDYETEVMAAGHHYVKAELHELVFFIRKDKSIPIGAAAANTAELDSRTLKQIGYKVSYKLYEWNGDAAKCDLEEDCIQLYIFY